MAQDITPKIIPQEIQNEVSRQINEGFSLWRGGFKALIDRHNAEMERHEEEFEKKRGETREKYRNGTKRTDGFII